MKIIDNGNLPTRREFCETISNPGLEGIILGELVRYETTLHGYDTNSSAKALAERKVHHVPRTVLLVTRYELKFTMFSSLHSPFAISTTVKAEMISRMRGARRKARHNVNN
jgi:hypothetical protein